MLNVNFLPDFQKVTLFCETFLLFCLTLCFSLLYLCHRYQITNQRLLTGTNQPRLLYVR